MNEKLFGALIGVVLTVVALSIAGYILARIQSSSSETNMPMGFGMMEMHGMMDDSNEHDMIEHMEEMMSDEEFQSEMIEHMESCPMMRSHEH